VCSGKATRPDGRRKYLACNDLRATPRQIVTGYRLRWRWRCFISVSSKISVLRMWRRTALTRWCRMSTGCIVPTFCCTWHRQGSPWSPEHREKQRALQASLAAREKRQILQKLTQLVACNRYTEELRQALAASDAWRARFDAAHKGVNAIFVHL